LDLRLQVAFIAKTSQLENKAELVFDAMVHAIQTASGGVAPAIHRKETGDLAVTRVVARKTVNLTICRGLTKYTVAVASRRLPWTVVSGTFGLLAAASNRVCIGVNHWFSSI
jgi:hypothetical protein